MAATNLSHRRGKPAGVAHPRPLSLPQRLGGSLALPPRSDPETDHLPPATPAAPPYHLTSNTFSLPLRALRVLRGGSSPCRAPAAAAGPAAPPYHLPPNTYHLPPTTSLRRRTAGFTLVEVLLASLILGIGLTVLLTSLSTCLRTMRMVRDYETVQWTLGLGELAYPEPMTTSTDVKEDYTVAPDTSLCEGFTFERVVDEQDAVELGKPEKQEKLCIVRTRVRWGEGLEKDQPCEELVRYVWERKK